MPLERLRLQPRASCAAFLNANFKEVPVTKAGASLVLGVQVVRYDKVRAGGMMPIGKTSESPRSPFSFNPSKLVILRMCNIS